MGSQSGQSAAPAGLQPVEQTPKMLKRFTRLQVFTVHLAISLAIFSALAAMMVLYWFPGPFFATDGGWQGIRIIAAVDLVLGPSLTLIFFSPANKTHRQLLFDLVAIALVQLAALVWGTLTVYNERTVAIAFSKDRFFSISHGGISEANEKLREAGHLPADIDALSDAHPRQIYVIPPKVEELPRYLADIFNGLPEIQLRTDRYTSLAAHWPAVEAQALDIREFVKRHPDLAADIDALLEPLDGLQFYALQLRFNSAVAVFDRQSRELRHIFTYDPAAAVKDEAKQ